MKFSIQIGDTDNGRYLDKADLIDAVQTVLSQHSTHAMDYSRESYLLGQEDALTKVLQWLEEL